MASESELTLKSLTINKIAADFLSLCIVHVRVNAQAIRAQSQGGGKLASPRESDENQLWRGKSFVYRPGIMFKISY